MVKIFSGDYSRNMWNAINSAKTITQLRWALYLVCCRLQELENILSENKNNQINRKIHTGYKLERKRRWLKG